MQGVIDLIKALFGLALAAGLLFVLREVALKYPDRELQIIGGVWAALIVFACWRARKFKSSGGESGMVVYEDYMDMFRCLSIAAVPFIIIMASMKLGQYESGKILGAAYAALMTMYIAYRAAQHNGWLGLPIVLIVKLSLSFLWMYSLVQVLSPSGKNAGARRDNRALAMLVLMFLTPLINMLMLDDKGKELVAAQFKGRRFAGAKSMRAALR